MNDFASVFRSIVDGYLIHLQNGGDPVQLEHKPRRHLEGLVHCSALFDCPLKESLSRRNVPAKFPSLLNVNRPTALMRMLQGNKVGEIMQEAMIWGSRQRRDMITWVEKFVDDEEDLHVQGQMDICIAWNGGSSFDIVELKHRLPNFKDKFPQPKLGDVFQLLAYMYANTTDFPDNGYLCIINTPAWADYGDPYKAYEVWTLEPKGDGYVLVSEHGHEWANERNTPDFINEETLRKEIEHHLKYMQNPQELPPPVNLANSEEAWQCRQVLRYPKGDGYGVMAPNCAYWCHTEMVPDEGLKYQVIDGEVMFKWEF